VDRCTAGPSGLSEADGNLITSTEREREMNRGAARPVTCRLLSANHLLAAQLQQQQQQQQHSALLTDNPV